MLENHSVIQRLEGKFNQSSCRIAILPTILSAVSSEKLNLVVSVLKKEEIDEEAEEDGIVLLEPPSIDQRIINQYSYFSIIPSGVEDIEQFLDEKTTRTVKYILDKEIRWQIRDMLDQCNVNERTIYPGLDGLASWIKRHYYVR